MYPAHKGRRQAQIEDSRGKEGLLTEYFCSRTGSCGRGCPKRGGKRGGWSAQEMKEWERLELRKGGKGWEDGAPRGGWKGGGRMWSSRVPTLKECVELSFTLIGKQTHGMALPVCVWHREPGSDVSG